MSFTDSLLAHLLQCKDTLGLSDHEAAIIDGIINKATMADVSATVGLTGSRVSQIAKKIPMRIASRIKKLGDNQHNQASRHPINYSALPSRIRSALKSLINEPVYWEDVTYSSREIMQLRHVGAETYNKIKELVSANCDETLWFMPHYSAAKQ